MCQGSAVPQGGQAGGMSLRNPYMEQGPGGRGMPKLGPASFEGGGYALPAMEQNPSSVGRPPRPSNPFFIDDGNMRVWGDPSNRMDPQGRQAPPTPVQAPAPTGGLDLSDPYAALKQAATGAPSQSQGLLGNAVQAAPGIAIAENHQPAPNDLFQTQYRRQSPQEAAQRRAQQDAYSLAHRPPPGPPVPLNTGAGRPPMPTKMQPGQQGWDYNNSFGGGSNGWTPVFSPEAWTYMNHQGLNLGRGLPSWWGEIDPNDQLGSIGRLSGRPFGG